MALATAGIAAAEPQDRCNAGDNEACLEVAEAAFKAKQKDTALVTAQGLCEKGEGEGCIRLAQYMDWFKLTVRGGKTTAQLRARGIQLLEAGCAKGSGPACGRLGKALYQGKHVTPEPRRGAELLDKGCTLKFAAACVYLASLDRVGAKGRAYLEKACDAGDGPGCTGLGDRDRKRAPELYGKACAADDAAGCSKLGALQRTARQVDKAVASFEHACELGLDEACVDAGALRESGKGVVDLVKARAHYAEACEAEVGRGCLGLALLVATTRGGPRNWGQAVELAQTACSLETKGACVAAKKLAARPPDGTCQTTEQCKPLCDEKIPKACLKIGELLAAPNTPDACDAAESYFATACQNDVGGAACLRAGHAADTLGDAAEHYRVGCQRRDPASCVMSAYANGDDAGYGVLEAACKKRQLDACFWLARLTRDVGTAQKHLRAACSKNNGRACELLAISLEEGVAPVEGRRGGGGVCCGADPDRRTRAERARDEARIKEAATLTAKACKLGRASACPTDDIEPWRPRTCRPGDIAWDQ